MDQGKRRFRLTIEPERAVALREKDLFRYLRRFLKALLRYYGLRCTVIEEVKPQ